MTDPTPWQIDGNPSADEVAAVVTVLSGLRSVDQADSDPGTGWASYWRLRAPAAADHRTGAFQMQGVRR